MSEKLNTVSNFILSQQNKSWLSEKNDQIKPLNCKKENSNLHLLILVM